VVTPLPGDFALTKISGLTGKAIAAGQALIGDAAPVQHAMVYVGLGMVVQAMPSGAERIPLEEASPVVQWSTGRIWLSTEQRLQILNEANDLVGTPYSFMDYASIGLAHFRVRPAPRRRDSGGPVQAAEPEACDINGPRPLEAGE
jgi:hypothetical protein